MELGDIGRRHAFAAAQFIDTVTERARITAGLPEPLQALRQQPCDGRLAVRTRHTNYFY